MFSSITIECKLRLGSSLRSLSDACMSSCPSFADADCAPFSADTWLVVDVVSASISVGLPFSKMSLILDASSTVLLAGTVSLLQTASASTEALEQ